MSITEDLESLKLQESALLKKLEEEVLLKENLRKVNQMSMEISKDPHMIPQAIKHLDLVFLNNQGQREQLNPAIMELYLKGECYSEIHKRDCDKLKACFPELMITDHHEVDLVLFEKLKQAALDFRAKVEADKLAKESARQASLDKLAAIGITADDIKLIMGR